MVDIFVYRCGCYQVGIILDSRLTRSYESWVKFLIGKEEQKVGRTVVWCIVVFHLLTSSLWCLQTYTPQFYHNRNCLDWTSKFSHLFMQVTCWLSQPWPQLVPVQCLSLITEVHDTLIVSAGDRPNLAILLQHYHLPSPNHGLIKVVSHEIRVQRGQVN